MQPVTIIKWNAEAARFQVVCDGEIIESFASKKAAESFVLKFDFLTTSGAEHEEGQS